MDKNVAKGIKANQRKTLVENNKLIAEFMGYEIREKGGKLDKYIVWFFPLLNEEKQPNTLFFHTSWDWLMPVVEKIESFEHIEHTVNIVYHSCDIEDYSLPGNGIAVNETAKTKKEATYNAVVRFIKWYNENYEEH